MSIFPMMIHIYSVLLLCQCQTSSTDQICYKNICYSILNFVFVMSHLVTLLFSPIHEIWTPINGVKFKIIFEIPICAWTDSSLFSCHYQCQLLTKLNPVVVFDVVAHPKRLNASTVCCGYYFG